jgi:broad specificity phosphatase PhoE
MIRLLVVRHGQSEWNALGRWQGQADPPLSDLGRHQAAHAAEHIGALDAIVSSDLERSRVTAEIIAEALGLGPVLVEPGFREGDAGEWTGLTKDEIEEAWPGYLADRRRPPGFEPVDTFRARVVGAMGRTRAEVGAGAVLVVAHAGVVYQVERHLGAPFEQLPNLAGRWVESGGPDSWRLGERVVLIEPGEVTVPGVL